MRTHRSDPSALRFLIGHELRSARDRADIKQSEAAKLIGCTPTKLSYLEAGKYRQQPDEVAALLRAYGMEVEHVARITSLATKVDERTWWAPYSDVLPDWFKTFVGLEGLAEGQFAYGVLSLPGQVQTEGYAAGVLADSIRVPQMDVAQVVRARMERQRIASEQAPLRFQAVIEESMLDRVVGGPQVMRAQLEYLLTLMKRDNVELRVMPGGVPVHDGFPGEFVVLDFAEAQSLAYIEYHTGALYLQDHEQVDFYRLTTERLLARAATSSESATMIEERISNYT